MFSRRLTRAIAIGATAIALGGGAYGVVSATASVGSGATTAATFPSATSGRPHARQRRIQRSVWTGRRGIIRHGRHRVQLELHDLDIRGSEGDHRRRRPLRHTRRGRARPRQVPLQKAKTSSYLGRPAERPSQPVRSSCNQMAAADLQLPHRQRWSPSSVAPRPRQSRSARSRRTTVRGQGQSSAERKRIRRQKLH